MGGTTGQPNYNGYKNDYCDRCEQGNGTFPVSWNMNTGQWNFDPTYGTDYCKCCTQDDSPLLPCSEVPNEWCIKWTQAQQSNNPAQIQAEINNFATTYGLTYSNAQNTLIKCCSGGADPVFVGMDGSSEGYGSIFSQKNYWIGVVAGVVGLMAYQKYVK